MSTATPPASLLHRVSGLVLYVFTSFTLAIVAVVAVLAVVQSLLWQAVDGHLLALVVMLGLLYWTTTLLPGPVKRLGKAAGKRVWDTVKKRWE